MKIITQINIMFLLSILTLSTVRADTLECVGMDRAGNTDHVIVDFSTLTLNVNGDILKLIGLTNNQKGFTTEQFVSDSGMLVFDSVGVQDPENALILTQFNADTNELISYAYLACH